jgi:hypothetical protein
VPPADGEMDGGAESSRFGVLSYGPPPLVLSGTAPGIDTEDRTALAPTSSAARGNRRPTGGPRAVLAVPAATSAVSAAAGSGGLTVSSAANVPGPGTRPGNGSGAYTHLRPDIAPPPREDRSSSTRPDSTSQASLVVGLWIYPPDPMR